MDQALVARARSGDRSAFDALILASYQRLFRLAHGILRDPTLAEDATQQAFVDIWRDLKTLRDPAKFEAWSYRVLVRVCYRESRSRPETAPANRVGPERIAGAWDPMGAVVDRDQLERGFARLSTDHRVVIVMRFLLDMSPEDISEALGIPRRTVYSRLKRAVPEMRAALEADSRPIVRPIPDRQEAS